MQGRHNLKNSQGDSGGDVDKIFGLILYDFKDFDIFSEKVGGMHPPYPPPCDVPAYSDLVYKHPRNISQKLHTELRKK